MSDEIEAEKTVESEATEVSEAVASTDAASEAVSEAVDVKSDADYVESEKENTENSEKSASHKPNFFLRLIKSIFILIASLVILFALWVSYSVLDRKNSLKYIPEDFFTLVHTDSAWKAVEPLLDLQAADMFLTNQNLTDLREVLMTLRSHKFRENKLVEFAASRKIDAAFYSAGQSFDFITVIDFSWLSSLTRIGNLLLKNIKIENLTFDYVSGFYEYKSPSESYYISFYKNLVLVSSSPVLLTDALKGEGKFFQKESRLLSEKSGNPLQIIANSKRLAEIALNENELLSKFLDYISEDTFTSVNISLTNENINIKANFPLKEKGDETDAVNKFLYKTASVPAFVSRLGANVQYYTLFNAGSLEELKKGIFPLMPAALDAENKWKTADKLCKSFFSISLEELLFSWTGNEFAVLGLENKNDPVFAIQIKDENQRKYIFDKLISSIIVKDNTSLVLDGIRLARLEIPDFLQYVLSLFDINLPFPYFMVKDGYIYLSESAENLSSIYMGTNVGAKLTQTENWKAVSSKQSGASTVSLYYNLERSIPFFIRTNAGFSDVMSLYSLGRFDIRLKDSAIQLQLQAISNKKDSSNRIYGFPIQLEAKNNGELLGTEKAAYWVENEKCLVRMDLLSTKITKRQFSDRIFIHAAKYSSDSVWVLTEQGEAFIVNDKLEYEENFPVYTGETPSAPPAINRKGFLIFTSVNKNLISVSEKGSVEKIALELSGNVKSSPSVEYVNGTEIIQLYDKSFFGKLVTVKNNQPVPSENISVKEIAFGSPALKKKGSDLYTSFITQNGKLYLWKNGELKKGFPIKVDGVFNTNAIASDDYIYVVSNDSVITRINYSGETFSVKFSHTKAENPFIRYENGKIYVCADGNSLYAFNEELEMLYGFPVAGWGYPVFADVNGDRKKDCIVLSVDKKINAYNLR